MEKNKHRFWCIVGDGECSEGSIWEAVLFAHQHGLDNLVIIIDYNGIQGLGNVAEIIDLEPFGAKWKAFGCVVEEIDGHNLVEIEETLKRAPMEIGRPTVVIAHTIKGKGVSFMEGQLSWHYKSPNDEQLTHALQEVKDQF